MRNKLLVILSVLIFGVAPVFAYAQEPVTANTLTTTDTTTTVTPPSTSGETNPGLLKVRPTIHQELKNARTDLHTQMMQARTDFKTKVSEIKDQKKQLIVTNFDTRINTVNKNRTDEMSKRLDRLTSILGKISTKEAALKASGKSTTTLDLDLSAAQAAINTAKQAVTDQAAMDYVMTITTDTALKTNASITIQQFLTDIKAVYTKVVAAQTAVVKSYTDTVKLIGTPTPSPLVSPTETTTP